MTKADRIAKLEEQVADLRSALQPFADYINRLRDDGWISVTCPVAVDPSASFRDAHLTFAELRRAATILEATKPRKVER